MAVIVHQRLSQLVTDFVLGNSGTIVPPASWTMGLSPKTVAQGARNSVWNANGTGTNINEIGATTPAGYARQTIARSINQGAIDWGTSTFDNDPTTGGQTTQADQVTFGPFSGAPNPNGANSFVITDGTTLNAGNPYFSGDTAATRTFANGDTEKVIAGLRAG